MGRIFEVRKHTMFARWNRMAKQFSRIGKDITIAVKKGGSDPNANPALRRAIQNSRAVNMPKDKVDSAIKRASGRDAANFEEVIYEGYAPHGVAVLVECATDNPTRTVAAIRNAFNKNGGNFSCSFRRTEYMYIRSSVNGVAYRNPFLSPFDHGSHDRQGRWFPINQARRRGHHYGVHKITIQLNHVRNERNELGRCP